MASKDWKESELQSSQAQYQSALGEVALDFLQRNQEIFGELPAISSEGARMLRGVLDELRRIRLAMPEPWRVFEGIQEINREAGRRIERAESAQAEAEIQAWRAEQRLEEVLEEREKYADEQDKYLWQLHGQLCEKNDQPSIRRLVMWLARRESYTAWLGLVK